MTAPSRPASTCPTEPRPGDGAPDADAPPGLLDRRPVPLRALGRLAATPRPARGRGARRALRRPDGGRRPRATRWCACCVAGCPGRRAPWATTCAASTRSSSGWRSSARRLSRAVPPGRRPGRHPRRAGGHRGGRAAGHRAADGARVAAATRTSRRLAQELAADRRARQQLDALPDDAGPAHPGARGVRLPGAGGPRPLSSAVARLQGQVLDAA